MDQQYVRKLYKICGQTRKNLHYDTLFHNLMKFYPDLLTSSLFVNGVVVDIDFVIDYRFYKKLVPNQDGNLVIVFQNKAEYVLSLKSDATFEKDHKCHPLVKGFRNGLFNISYDDVSDKFKFIFIFELHTNSKQYAALSQEFELLSSDIEELYKTYAASRAYDAKRNDNVVFDEFYTMLHNFTMNLKKSVDTQTING